MCVCVQLKSRSGAEFLIQYDTESIINDWHKVIVDTIRQLVSLASTGLHLSIWGVDNILCLSEWWWAIRIWISNTLKMKRRWVRSLPVWTEMTDSPRDERWTMVKSILKATLCIMHTFTGFKHLFLRISKSTVFIQLHIWVGSEEGPHQTEEVSSEAAHAAVRQRQGIHQRWDGCFSISLPAGVTEMILMWRSASSSSENVFGCHLHNLCLQEKSTVPSFVEKCIRTVERRGATLCSSLKRFAYIWCDWM